MKFELTSVDEMFGKPFKYPNIIKKFNIIEENKKKYIEIATIEELIKLMEEANKYLIIGQEDSDDLPSIIIYDNYFE